MHPVLFFFFFFFYKKKENFPTHAQKKRDPLKKLFSSIMYESKSRPEDDLVPVKMKHHTYTTRFFDPHRSCGSHSRSKFGYLRSELVSIAQKNNIPGAHALTSKALCNLLRTIYYENEKTSTFVREMELDLDNIPIPAEIPFLNGTLSVANYKALAHNVAKVGALKAKLRELMRDERVRDSDLLQLKLTIFAQIVDPDGIFDDMRMLYPLANYASRIQPLVAAFVHKVQT
jgi:hypothetical protein